MPPKNAMDALFGSLSNEEKMHLKGRFRGRKLAMVTAFIDKRKYLQRELGKEFATIPKNSFATARADILKKAAELLHEFRKPKTMLGPIHAQQQLGRSYEIAGNYPKAKQAYANAAKMAERLEAFDLTKESWASIVLMLGEDTAEARPYLELQNIQTDRQHELTTLEILLRKIEPIKRLQEPQRSKQAQKLLDKVQAMHVPPSIKGAILHTRLLTFCYVITGQLEEAHLRLEDLRQRVLESPRLHFEKLFIQSLVAIHLVLSGLNVHFGRAEAAMEILKVFVEWLEAGGFECPNVIRMEQAKVAIDDAWQLQNLKQFGTQTDQMLDDMGNGLYTDPKRRLIFSIYFADKFITLKQPKNALKWLDQAFADRRAEIMPEWLAVAAMMECACYYMLKDWDLLGPKVDGLRHILRSRNQMNTYTKVVIKAFRAVVQNPYASKEAIEVLVKEITPLIGDLSFKIFHDMFDILAWASIQLH